ncbi:MAG: hypothetical protein ABIE23_04835 [archaeon]
MKEKIIKFISISLFILILFLLIGCVELTDYFDPWRQAFQKESGQEVELEGYINGIGTFPKEIIEKDELVGYLWKSEERIEGIPLILKEEINCEGKKVKVIGEIEKRTFRPSSTTMDYMQWVMIKVGSYECTE